MAVPFSNVANSATIGTTEWSMPANASGPTAQTTAVRDLYVLVDATAMAAGDQFNVVPYEKVNGGTQRPIATFALVGARTELEVYGPFRLSEGWDVTIKKIAGTYRSIAWSVREDVGDANALTAGSSAVTSIQSGLATAAAVAGVQSDTDDIQSRLPATLDGSGNMRSQVKGMDASTLSATAVSAGAVSAIQSGLPTTTTVNAIKAKTDNLPATPADQATLLLVKAKTDNLPASPADETLIITATNALAAAISALPTASQNAVAVMASTVDGTETLKEALAVALAEIAGNATIDEATGAYAFKGKDGTTTRLAGTISGTARTVTTRNGA